MGGGGSQPQPVPAPTPTPPPPERTQAQIQNAGAEQRQRYWGAQGGRTTTMLTSGSGAETPSTTVRLLGNVGR